MVRNAAELRVKETDRIAAVTKNLAAIGVRAEVFEDGFAIEGPQPLRGAVIDSMEDHRIAMAFTVAGLLAQGETRINGTECADISYPGFFNLLSGIDFSRTFCVIGDPIGHTLSPLIHAAVFKQLGVSMDYEAVRVAPDRLAGFVEESRRSRRPGSQCHDSAQADRDSLSGRHARETPPGSER